MPKMADTVSGALGAYVAEADPEVLDLGRREGQDAAMEIRAERMEPELERGRDPEIPAGAAQAPEELGLLGLGRADEPPVGRDELDGGQVVDREPEVALEAAHSPTERQPGDAGVADDAGRADETVRLRGDVELAEQRAAVRTGGPGPRIRLDAAHPRTCRRGVRHSRPRSPAALWPPDRTVISRSCSRAKRTAAGDLLGARRAGDDRRPAIVDRVPQAARVVVACVLGRDHLVARSAQLIDVVWRDRAVVSTIWGYASAPAPIATVPSERTGVMRPKTLPSGSSR